MTAPDILLQWHRYGVTYQLMRLDDDKAWLVVSGPGTRLLKGRRDLPMSVVEAWRSLPDAERCVLADRELGAVVKRSSGEGAIEDPLKVLIVEDHLDTAAALSNLLSGWGFKGTIARTGADALRLAADFHPRVVLLDLGLPDQHGYTVARQLRDRAEWRLSIVVVTGWAEAVDKTFSMNFGISHHLAKPVNPDSLRQILQGYHQAA